MRSLNPLHTHAHTHINIYTHTHTTIISRRAVVAFYGYSSGASLHTTRLVAFHGSGEKNRVLISTLNCVK